ncbi:hypothetical protein [Nevskia sp.]|uniref:hypothetical protein n=1 Tax=Nevskia sp. TaxID=1929292 RepID=UPI0025FBFEE8|nr:hypothetical protein [Nevskia sp.]
MIPSVVDDADVAGWPVTPDGWKVVSINRSLFPGGPSGFRVSSPDAAFFFGLNFEPASGDPCRAVITSFGISSAGSTWHYVLTTPEAMGVAQARVRDLLLTYPLRFHYRWFDAVEFRRGDGRIVEIF